MPMPPAPPPPYDWMPFTQRVLRALPVHPAISGLVAFGASAGLFTVLLLFSRGGGTFAGLAEQISIGFWADYLVMGLITYVFVTADLLRRHLERSLDRLEPALVLTPEDFARARAEVLRYGRPGRDIFGFLVIIAVISGGGGLARLANFQVQTLFDWIIASIIYVRVATLLWASSTLLHDEMLALSRLSRLVSHHLEIDLFIPMQLAPLRQIGLVATLAMALGVSASTPLLDEVHWALATLAYLLLIVAASLVLLVLPVLGARQAIAAAKQREVARLNAMIENHPGRFGDDLQSASDLGGIVALRLAVEQAQEWPFGRPTLVRWGLIVLIPVGSWFAGALVERIVDVLIP